MMVGAQGRPPSRMLEGVGDHRGGPQKLDSQKSPPPSKLGFTAKSWGLCQPFPHLQAVREDCSCDLEQVTRQPSRGRERSGHESDAGRTFSGLLSLCFSKYNLPTP